MVRPSQVSRSSGDVEWSRMRGIGWTASRYRVVSHWRVASRWRDVRIRAAHYGRQREPIPTVEKDDIQVSPGHVALGLDPWALTSGPTAVVRPLNVTAGPRPGHLVPRAPRQITDPVMTLRGWMAQTVWRSGHRHRGSFSSRDRIGRDETARDRRHVVREIDATQ
jgi:hypothetical protein